MPKQQQLIKHKKVPETDAYNILDDSAATPTAAPVKKVFANDVGYASEDADLGDK